MLSLSAPKFTGGDCSFCEYTFTSGHKHVGSWKNGKPHGQGIKYYGGEFKGDTVSGLWVEGKLSETGKKGTYTWANGNYYTGTWSNNAPHIGTHFFKDGTKHVGTFIDTSENKGKGSWDNELWSGTIFYPDGRQDILQDGKILRKEAKEVDEETIDKHLNINDLGLSEYTVVEEAAGKEATDETQKLTRLVAKRLCANEAKDAKNEYAAKKIESICLESYGYTDNNVSTGFKILKIFSENYRTVLISFIFEAFASSLLFFLITFKFFERKQKIKLRKVVILYGSITVAIAAGFTRMIILLQGFDMLDIPSRSNDQILVFAGVPIIFSFIAYKLFRSIKHKALYNK